MLTSVRAFSRRAELDVDALAARMVTDGQKSIQDLKDLMAAGKRAARSGGR